MTTFERYRPAMAVFFGVPFITALIFGGVVIAGGSPVKPEFYGPIVYAIPALTWVSIQIVFSLAAIIGCAVPMPRLAAIGAMGIGLLFEFFASAAIVAGASGTLLVAGSIPIGALAMVAAAICWRGRHGTYR